MIIILTVNDFLRRWLTPVVERALKASPIVVVTGSRQVGKSTLVQHLGGGGKREYLTLDDVELLGRARDEPDALLRSDQPLTIDEVQRAPDLLLSIKRAVDRDRSAGRFLLTGSADFRLLKAVSESLAGRALTLQLWPLTRRERAGLGEPGRWRALLDASDEDWPALLESGDAEPADWRRAVRTGGYPVPAHDLTDAQDRSLWFAGYTQTYLERDLRELSAVSSLPDFRRLMRAACLRLGNLVNQTELGRDVGLSQATVHRHLNLLETSFQLVRLPPYSVNRTKRLIKTPKLYWCDSGLAMHLANESEPRGAHLENLVLSDLLAWAGAIPDGPALHFWRTQDASSRTAARSCPSRSRAAAACAAPTRTA